MTQTEKDKHMKNIVKAVEEECITDFSTWFNGVTVPELKESIETFNTLIVRLPVDTPRNRITSLHIFQDWRTLFNESVKALIEKGELF